MLTEFTRWANDLMDYLVKVKSLLSNVLSDDEESIINQIRTIEAHYARIGCILAEANSWLDRLTDQYISDSEIQNEKKTVKEREISADGALAPVREFRDKLQTVLRAIELRITLSQSILRQQRGEKKNG